MSTDPARFQRAIDLIDDRHRQDPNLITYEGKTYPKELLYAQRISECLDRFAPDATESLKIAARGHHIERWKIARSDFSQDRKGYLQWRNELKSMHAGITSQILREVGYERNFVEAVSDLIQKKNLKKNTDAQTLEDVICLVFIQFYLEDFSKQKDDQKIIEILRKTWRKMSAEGQREALALPISKKVQGLIEKAINQ